MIRRRRHKLQWFLIVLSAVFVSATIMYKNISDLSRRIPKETLLSVGNFTTRKSLNKPKHVTRSMAQLGQMDEVNKHFLFLNPVPKSGSEILIFLLEKLQGGNSFKHVRLKGGSKRKLSVIQQENIVDEIYSIRRNLPVPLSFDRHVYFINFTSFDKQLPTYINLIRHPVAKVMARAISKTTGTYDSYFIKCVRDKKRNRYFKNGRPYDLTIPYFCGHDPKCMLLNDAWALESAKANVDKYYKKVGVLEELNKTLEVLEEEIPQFFAGAKEMYQQNLLDTEIYRHKKDPEIPKDVRIILEKTLVTELEFYHWIRSKLLN